MAAFTGGAGTPAVPADDDAGALVVEQWPDANNGASATTNVGGTCTPGNGGGGAGNPFDLNRLPPAQARYYSALKEKYQAVKAGVPLANARDVHDTIKRNAPAVHGGGGVKPLPLNQRAATASAADVAAAEKRLERCRVCLRCGGTGTFKMKYNFMTIDQDCTDCDGEGVLRPKEDAAASAAAAATRAAAAAAARGAGGGGGGGDAPPALE